MPVRQGNQSVACCLTSDSFFFRHHIVLDKRKHLLPIMHRNEYFLIQIEVVRFDITLFLVTLHPSAEGIQQTVIYNESRCYNQKVLRETESHLPSFGGGGGGFSSCIQHLPQQQGMHHPRLARSRCHLHGIFRHLIFLLSQGA